MSVVNHQIEATLNIRQEGDMFSLTDLWKSAGSPSGKAPADWQQSKSVQEFLEMASASQNLNAGNSGIIKTQRGRGKMQGTWAHKIVALAYAKYLDPKLHVLVNEVFFERVEEEANPELAVQRGNARAAKTWAKQGKSDQWIEERIIGIAGRKAFTSGLAQHGVRGGAGFRNCTNAIYIPLYGGTTAVVRQKKNLSAKDNIRDNMNALELASTRLSELLALNTIQVNNLNGNGQCEMACTQAAKSVANAIMENRRAAMPAPK